MMKNLLLKITFYSFLILFAGSSFAQTFWGTTPYDGRYHGGTIFSFDAKTDTYIDEYFFMPNPVNNARHVFEASPGIYAGISEGNWDNSIPENEEKGISVFQYDAVNDKSEILFTYPRNSYQSYDYGSALLFNNQMYRLQYLDEKTVLTSYSIDTDKYLEIGDFSSENYPDEGVYSYSSTNTRSFTAISDELVLFSMARVIGAPDYATTRDGYVFFGYNPLSNQIGEFLHLPYSAGLFPQGPLVQTNDNRWIGAMSASIVEINPADSSYTNLYSFTDGLIISGKMHIASDSTIVGIRNISESGYLFEYDFKNNKLLNNFYLWSKGLVNAFVKRGDSVFFAGEDDRIFSFKPGSNEEPKVSYQITGYNQGYIKILLDHSDSETILSFADGLHAYSPEKGAYTTLVRFTSSGGGYWGFNEGASPSTELLLASNGKLYGIGVNGGRGNYSHGDGVLFEMDPETKDYQVTVHFTGENGGFGDRDSYGTVSGKGQNNLLEVNQKIYGTTYTNGDYIGSHLGPGYGTVFSYDLSAIGNNFSTVIDFNDSTDASAGRLPMSGLTLGSNGKLYGTTSQGGIGGIWGHGVVYEIDPSNKDAFRVVMKIPETAMRSVDNLVEAENGKFYGLATEAEFSNADWAIREYDMENQSFTDIFLSEESNLEYNYAQFALLNNKLYGGVSSAYDAAYGYIFEFDLTSRQLVKKLIFANGGEEGARPKGNMVLSSSGSFWGMTGSGGVHSDDWGDYDHGVIYEFNPTDASYVKHYDFGGAGGSNPHYATLVETAGVDYTGINPMKTVKEMEVYPNPTADFVKFEFTETGIQNVSYSIFDTTGKLIDSQTITVSDNLILDLSGLKQGVYVVKINTANQTYSKTIIRKQ